MAPIPQSEALHRLADHYNRRHPQATPFDRDFFAYEMRKALAMLDDAGFVVAPKQDLGSGIENQIARWGCVCFEDTGGPCDSCQEFASHFTRKDSDGVARR